MKTYPFPAQLVQQLVDYLGTKPFNEVVNLMVGIKDIVRQVDMPPEQPPVPPPDKRNGKEVTENANV